MSKTLRRTNFNRKHHIFIHYWEAFSDQEIIDRDYIPLWKYHGDNYYTKRAKEVKQFYKNQMDRKQRREAKLLLKTIENEQQDIVLSLHTKHCVRWMVH